LARCSTVNPKPDEAEIDRRTRAPLGGARPPLRVNSEPIFVALGYQGAPPIAAIAPRGPNPCAPLGHFRQTSESPSRSPHAGRSRGYDGTALRPRSAPRRVCRPVGV